MNKKERSDWQKWWQFLGRRVREFTFLSAWVGMTFCLNVYIINFFPVSGPPKYMLHVFEVLFDIFTLVELVLLLFWPYWAATGRLLNRRNKPKVNER